MKLHQAASFRLAFPESLLPQQQTNQLLEGEALLPANEIQVFFSSQEPLMANCRHPMIGRK